MRALLLASVICTLLLPTASGYTFEEPPSRVIECARSDEVCDITLSVSYTFTLVAHLIFRNRIQDVGAPVFVNSTGGYELEYGSLRLQRIQPVPGDGITRRPIYAINNLFPGPTIMGYTNQTVRIRVINRLPVEAVSMHWHGMHQIGTPHMDGVPYITQCPILPNNEFTYQFQLYPEGTFWYHAHIGAERSNGLYGALIVRPMEPEPELVGVFDNPGEHTLLLNEWYTVNSQELQLSTIDQPDPKNPRAPYHTNAIPSHDGTTTNRFLPAGLLINNAGWLYTDDENCKRLANTTLPAFSVSQGNCYRFRVIGSHSNQPLRISVRNHRLQLIATDGVKTNISRNMPQEVDFIIVNVAERYDFIVHANQAVDNYAIVVETLDVPGELERRGYCLKAHRGYAVLRYEGASEDLPEDFDSYDPYARCTANQPCYAVNCPFQNYPDSVNTTCINTNNLQLVNPEPVPNQDVSETVFLNFYLDVIFGVSVNYRGFRPPSSPLLSQIENVESEMFCEYDQEKPASDFVRSCLHTYTATTETIDMVFSNFAESSFNQHPIHIHGHYFHILHVGYPTYNEDGTISERNKDINCTFGDRQCDRGVVWANGAPPTSACLATDSCPKKDTVTMPAGGYVWVRMARNNPSWWLLHCHNELHFEFGMAMVINATGARGNIVIPTNFPRCGDFSQDMEMTTEPVTTEPPQNECTEPVQNESTYRSVSIALGIVSGVLLLVSCTLLIALIVEKSSGKKEQYQLKNNVEFKSIPSDEVKT